MSYAEHMASHSSGELNTCGCFSTAACMLFFMLSIASDEIRRVTGKVEADVMSFPVLFFFFLPTFPESC